MPPPATAPRPGQEIELWWGGYAPRTMLPSALACILAAVCLIGAAAYISGEERRYGSLARWSAYHAMLLLWLVQFIRWAYRVAGYEYRLTNHRLFVNEGPLFSPLPPAALDDVKAVHVAQSTLERWLGVGHITIEGKERLVPLVLRGVRRPESVADLIRTAAARAREAAALPVPS